VIMKKTAHPSALMSSKEYEKFHPNPLQQEYKPHHVQRLTNSIIQFGYLKSQPISVYPHPSKAGHYIINTGHHRFDGAKAAGQAFWYIVEHKWTPEELIREGVQHRTWSIKCCAAVWVDAGLPDYLVLMGYVQKGLPINFAGSLLRGECASSGNAGPAIAAGTFKVKTTETADAVLSVLEELGESVPEVKSRVFMSALSALLFTPVFDLARLMSRLRANPSALEKRSTRDDMLRQLEEIYNFKQRDKVNIAFQAQETLHNRKVGFGREGEPTP